MFRIFKRKVWTPNANWPNGYEPLAVPMDKCSTLREFETRAGARAYCGRHNDPIRDPENDVSNEEYYNHEWYEFTET